MYMMDVGDHRWYVMACPMLCVHAGNMCGTYIMFKQQLFPFFTH